MTESYWQQLPSTGCCRAATYSDYQKDTKYGAAVTQLFGAATTQRRGALPLRMEQSMYPLHMFPTTTSRTNLQ